MKVETTFLIYLLIINLLSGIIFAYDKRAAINNHHRTSERTLHILEMMGGVFANMLLMYGMHHKNRKFRYYGVTWVVMMGWMFLIIIELK